MESIMNRHVQPALSIMSEALSSHVDYLQRLKFDILDDEISMPYELSSVSQPSGELSLSVK